MSCLPKHGPPIIVAIPMLGLQIYTTLNFGSARVKSSIGFKSFKEFPTCIFLDADGPEVETEAGTGTGKGGDLAVEVVTVPRAKAAVADLVVKGKRRETETGRGQGATAKVDEVGQGAGTAVIKIKNRAAQGKKIMMRKDIQEVKYQFFLGKSGCIVQC